MVDMLPVTQRTSKKFLVYVEVVLPSIKFLPPQRMAPSARGSSKMKNLRTHKVPPLLSNESQLSIYTRAKLNQFFTPGKG
jgi:hypothetical protein